MTPWIFLGGGLLILWAVVNGRAEAIWNAFFDINQTNSNNSGVNQQPSLPEGKTPQIQKNAPNNGTITTGYYQN